MINFCSSRKRALLKSLLALASCLFSKQSFAVPQVFLQEPAGQQADITWGRLENDKFIIYFDSKQPALAEHALRAVENAYPDFSLLLGTTLADQPLPSLLKPQNVIVSRFNKIPIIVSSRTDGPSFANFIPQTLEIQSTLRPPSALFQHELAHRMMYEHIDLKVGPAGRTFMLAMLPTWWTEGLPEYLTESLGRLQTEGYLRAMALNDTFLSWDRMHALYKASGSTAMLGYATAGRFFKYFLERTPEKSLISLHQSLKGFQLIPPFFSGAYLLIKDKTGEWPGDLYESFKKEVTKTTLKDLQGMPRLKNIDGAQRIFNSFGGAHFIVQNSTMLFPDFTTPSRDGGMVVYEFSDDSLREIKKASLLPLKLKSQDRIIAHREELTNGGFWSTKEISAPNRTSGNVVTYNAFTGPLKSVKDSKLKSSVEFSLAEDNLPPIVREVVSLAPKTSAVLSTLNTATSLYILDAESKTQKFINKWIAPDSVNLVRPHDAIEEIQSKSCVHVLVDHDAERTSLQRACHGEAPVTIIPEGQFLIRDAIQTGQNEFLLLVGWHNIQALLTWSNERTEFVSGFPDWVENIIPGRDPESLYLSVFNGRTRELWSVKVNSLHTSHLAWIAKQPENSKWWKPPNFQPYQPPYAKYATAMRAGTPHESPKNLEQNQAPIEKSITTVPAPYRFKHWMTYPNYTPSFLAGVTSLGLFSRPFVDEMERFYVQLFGSYVFDDSLENSDRWGLEANLVGNRIFDGWKANVFVRPRFNGIAYAYRCRLSRNDPNVYLCPEKRPSDFTEFYSYTYLREMGADFQLNKELADLKLNSDVHARVFKINPTAPNSFVADSDLGAQNTVLASLGASVSKSLWKKVFFTAPVSSLDKGEISAGGSLRIGADTTHSLTKALAGGGTELNKVGFQNYSLELSHNAAYLGHNVGIRTSYSSTGGGNPLNLQEFFRPFKTYLIGANDGLQDISTSLAGNGLLSYNLVGRAQYRNSISYAFPIIHSLDTRFGPAFLERLEGEVVLSRGGVSDKYDLSQTYSITTLTGSMRLNIDVKGYGFYPAILYGQAIDKPLWQLFTQIRFDQFW